MCWNVFILTYKDRRISAGGTQPSANSYFAEKAPHQYLLFKGLVQSGESLNEKCFDKIIL